MAYTNVWSNTFPADSEAANAIGSNLRQVRFDLAERFTGFLVVDLTADPLVLAPAIIGAVTGAQRIVSFNQFVNYVTPSGIGIANGYITVQSAEPAYAAVPVPVGCVITKVEWLTDSTAATTPNGSLQKQTFDTLVTNTVISSVALTVGFQINSSAVLAETVATDHIYWLKIGCGACSLKLYGVRITFNRYTSAHAS